MNLTKEQKNKIKEILPLLEKLQGKKILISAIMQDKISEKLARSLHIHEDEIDEILQAASKRGEILY